MAALSAGVVLGGQVGVRLAPKLPAVVILRVLAGLMLMTGVRLAWVVLRGPG